MREDAKRESMPRKVYLRNTHTNTLHSPGKNACDVEARFQMLLERLVVVPGRWETTQIVPLDALENPPRGRMFTKVLFNCYSQFRF